MFYLYDQWDMLIQSIDVRTLVDNDEALQEGILQALEQYNTEQLITVTPPGLDYEVRNSKNGIDGC